MQHLPGAQNNTASHTLIYNYLQEHLFYEITLYRRFTKLVCKRVSVISKINT